jgi:hypothetical protein
MSKNTENGNYTSDSITIRGELEASLTNPETRRYLDNIFTMLRTIVGINCLANDFIAAEMKKETPDIRAINDALSNNDAQMMTLLGSLSDAHHLLALMETPETENANDISETLKDIVEKITPLFGGNIMITSDIEDMIYASVDRVSFEIAVSDHLEHLLSTIKPKAVDFRLRSEGIYEAVLIIRAIPGGQYPLPGRTEAEKAVRSEEFSAILMENLLRRMKATVCHTSVPEGAEVELRFVTLRSRGPKFMAPNKKFEFDNVRFSPVSSKLYKYFALFNKRY